jgi:hypothetical protein
MVTFVAFVNVAMVVPLGMFVPDTLLPTSVAVKFAVAELMAVLALVVVPSVIDRAPDALSIFNKLAVVNPADVPWLSVTRHAPLIDFTNVRAAMPVPAIDWFTKPVAPAQFAAVNVVDPAETVVVGETVRAAPLWYTASEKSWNVKFDDTCDVAVRLSKTHATIQPLCVPPHAG